MAATLMAIKSRRCSYPRDLLPDDEELWKKILEKNGHSALEKHRKYKYAAEKGNRKSRGTKSLLHKRPYEHRWIGG